MRHFVSPLALLLLAPPAFADRPESEEAAEASDSSATPADDEADAVAAAERDPDDVGVHLPDTEKEKEGLIEELTYLQWPGLPPAASKIYFSERRYAISGFGEISYNGYLGDKNRASGDLELYNTNLYRFVVYGAYRVTPWMVVFAEFFAELYHDGLHEADYEIFPEVFVDFVISKPFNVRVGFSQVPIGYVNNNDEPILFYSVNRPEVERLIIPSQWIELGVQVYGKVGERASWMVHGFQGVDGTELLGASWVRQGRHPRFNFNTPAVAGQFNVSPIDHLDLSVAGLYMESGSRGEVDVEGSTKIVRAPTTMASLNARYEHGDFSLNALGVLGSMGQTDMMFDLTRTAGHDGAQILGNRVYGAYLEAGWDILPLLRGREEREGGSFFHRANEMRLPLFLRYERLDTHARVDGRLLDLVGPDTPMFRSNLDVLTMGANFNTRKNLVFKANYQLRHNRSVGDGMVQEGDRVEVGMGFIF
ncbi:MAG: porin [Deltaproteobacteria bacterium]|nr:MAG: porin [Deltaproteobacteria bacterium]